MYGLEISNGTLLNTESAEDTEDTEGLKIDGTSIGKAEYGEPHRFCIIYTILKLML